MWACASGAIPDPVSRTSWDFSRRGGDKSGLGVGILLIALGAIAVWALETRVAGVEIPTIGWILMIVGVVGLFVALLRASAMTWRRERRDEERVVLDRR